PKLAKAGLDWIDFHAITFIADAGTQCRSKARRRPAGAYAGREHECLYPNITGKPTRCGQHARVSSDQLANEWAAFRLHPNLEGWKLLKIKSGRRGSNPRRPAWEAGILPLNYSRLTNELTVCCTIDQMGLKKPKCRCSAVDGPPILMGNVHKS